MFKIVGLMHMANDDGVEIRFKRGTREGWDIYEYRDKRLRLAFSVMEPTSWLNPEYEWIVFGIGHLDLGYPHVSLSPEDLSRVKADIAAALPLIKVADGRLPTPRVMQTCRKVVFKEIKDM